MAVVAREGQLLKWTNYLTGWQSRYFVLSNGVLSYYASKAEMGLGCRGAVNVADCEINVDLDTTCEFRVVTADKVFYLKADSAKARQAWLVSLGSAKSQAHTVTENGPAASGKRPNRILQRDDVVQRVLDLRQLIRTFENADPSELRCLDACNSFLEILRDCSLKSDQPTVNGTVESGDHDQSNQPATTDLSAGPTPAACRGDRQVGRLANLTDKLFAELSKVIPSNDRQSVVQFFHAVVDLVEILNAIDASSMAIIKMEVAESLQRLTVIHELNSDRIETLQQLLSTESKLGSETMVVRESMERLRRVLLFLRDFFFKLHLADALPSACAQEAYCSHFSEAHSRYLRYLFSEYAKVMNSRKAICCALNQVDKNADPVNSVVDFALCAATMEQCIALLDTFCGEDCCN